LAIGLQNGNDSVFVFSIDEVCLCGGDFSIDEVENDCLSSHGFSSVMVIFCHHEPITGKPENSIFGKHSFPGTTTVSSSPSGRQDDSIVG
jgi:hypothetical protein